MTTYFPASGVEVAIWIPPLAAFIVSFFTSMGGVSGAFLLLPFQVSVLGYTAPSVSATNQVFNVVAIPAGVWRYLREGRMIWPLCLWLVVGSVPGVLVGALVRIGVLRNPALFKAFVALVLLYIAGRMLRDLARPREGGGTAATAERVFRASARGSTPGSGKRLPAVAAQSFGLRRSSFVFCGQRFVFSTPAVLGLSFVVGIVGGIYGIGGGAIVAPLLVALFRLPVYAIAGTALLSTCVSAVAGVGIYQALAPLHPAYSIAPDWALGFLFGAGGVGGMYLGARCQKLVPSRAIKAMLGGVMLLTASRYLFEIVTR